MRFRSLEREYDAIKAKVQRRRDEARELDKLLKAERRFQSPLPALRKQAGEVLHECSAKAMAEQRSEIHKLRADAQILHGQATILANRVGVSAQNAPSTVTIQ